jgi:hypothetical protein
MLKTEINTTIDITAPDNDCIAVALLSETGQQQLTSLLEGLRERLGDTIWPMPAAALHITLCEIIQPKPYIEDKAALLKNFPHYEAVLEEILTMPPIPITFDTIEVSPQTIIVRGRDNGTFNRIREQLVEKLPLPNETKSPPDIIHSSIARYTKEVDMEEVKAVVADFSISFVETISEFQLLRQTAPHLLNYIIARRYALNSAN